MSPRTSRSRSSRGSSAATNRGSTSFGPREGCRGSFRTNPADFGNERLLGRRQSSPADSKGFPMTTTNKQILEQAYASFAAGDVPAALAAFADDIRWTEPDGYPIAGTFVGPQA